jgi:uncharacterized protein (DUF362 family)
MSEPTGRMREAITRREWLAATAAAAVATGCARPVHFEPSETTIVRAAAYDQRLYDIVRQLIAAQRLAVRGRSVVIKPNLVEFEPGTAINTHPLLVHAACEAFRALGASQVTIAEGPGHRRDTLDLAEAAGYFRIIPGFEDSFVDLNVDEVTLVDLPQRFSRLKRVYLPNTVLGAGLLVSMPKMKTHHWVGATLSMKNLFGVVPSGVYGWPKNVLHWAGITESIADLHSVLPRAFTLVDGIVGMEGNGPIQGVPKQMGVLVAGADPVAVDATCCRLMRLDPLRMDYMRLSAGDPARLAEANIRQAGESIATLAQPFALLPQFNGLRL